MLLAIGITLGEGTSQELGSRYEATPSQVPIAITQPPLVKKKVIIHKIDIDFDCDNEPISTITRKKKEIPTQKQATLSQYLEEPMLTQVPVICQNEQSIQPSVTIQKDQTTEVTQK